jgi:predicted NBD/HSP70 family sugar kinase
VTASDEALARRAVEAGVVDEPDVDAVRVAARRGDLVAHGLLLDRAGVLGRTAAIVRDMVAPDRVVLVGQAFTGYPQAMGAVTEALLAATTLGPVDVSFTRFGAGVQAAASGAVALGPVYEDPLGLVRGDRDPAAPVPAY